MKVASVELTNLDVPFEQYAGQHLQYWIAPWRVVQVCKLTLDNGVVGWGETIPNATMPGYRTTSQSASPAKRQRLYYGVTKLGAGVQIALFDAVGENENVPICDLLGRGCATGVRSPGGPATWARRIGGDSARWRLRGGTMSAKLKTRPWQDLHACLQAVLRVIPAAI